MRLSVLCGLVLLGVVTLNCSGGSTSAVDKDETGSGGTEESGTSSHAGGKTAKSTTGRATSVGGRSHRGGAASVGGTSNVQTGGAKATGGTSSRGGTGNVQTGGAKVAGGTTSTGGSTNTTTVTCSGTGGPTMVSLPPGYCIDSTEVTRDQYAAWLATNPALPASDDANCGWKASKSYAADVICMESPIVCKGANCGNHPQVCVDWCDAYAYCAGVGKRLCGKIGGGTNAYDDSNKLALSQWYNACASGSPLNDFPFGGESYREEACNGYYYWGSNSTFATIPVGSASRCQAPIESAYRGVFDMSGNVSEWEDCCDGTGQSANCRARGLKHPLKLFRKFRDIRLVDERCDRRLPSAAGATPPAC